MVIEWRAAPLSFWSTLGFSLTHALQNDTLCRAGRLCVYGGVIHTEFIRLRCSVQGLGVIHQSCSQLYF